MKKFYPYLLFIIFLIGCIFFWDKIKIPYDESNLIQGEFFSKKNNPINEILRFLIFIFIPLLIFLVSYLKFNKKETYEINPNDNNFFLKKVTKIFKDDIVINKITFILLIIITLEFFIIDFTKYVYEFDVFHEGTYLVPPINYIFKDSFWLSTLYDYGFVANNLGLFIWKLMNFYSIGSIRFITLFLIFLNKILLILICRRLSLTLNFEQHIRNIFFLSLSLIIISFINYAEPDLSFYPPRAFVFLVFFLFLIDVLVSKESFILKPFIIGAFSLVSILWWIDIGAYINAIIIIVFIYLFIQKEYLTIKYILIGILSTWFIFFISFPLNEIKEFFFQLKFIFNISDYLLGLEYPKPFSLHSARETKALLFIIFSGIFLIILNFNKKLNVDFTTKIIISFLFISSIIFFKSGLTRTDAPHLKASSGSYMFVFYFCILYFIFYKLQNARFIVFFKKLFLNKMFFVYFLITLISFLSILKFKVNNISHIFNSKKNIHTLLYAKDELFLTDNYSEFLKYYSEISKDDKCVQVLSDDVALPYLLKKPSCTQFFIPAHILIGWNENKFIDQMNKSNPNFILYSSPITMLTNKKNMPKVDLFIKNNYYLFRDFMGWKIYEKKKIFDYST